MNRPDDDELQPDECLRAALRHAPDAQREPPAAVTAHILSTARAAAAQPSSAPAASPAAAKRRPAWGLGSWVLARPGFALGLVALAGAAALWGLQRPGETRPVLPDPSLAQAPSADAAPAPLVVAQADVVQAEVAAPAAMLPEPAPAAPPRRSAALRKAQPHERAEMHVAVPEILVMSPAPPPPAEFKPAPPPAAAPAVALAEQVVVTGSAARASQVPAAVSAAPAEREPPANPARAWLAALPADEAAQRSWLLALADATEGRWQDGLPLIALPETRAALTDTRRERSSLSQAMAASAAQTEERWAALQIDGRRAILRALPQGLLWCEAGRCRYAPLSPQLLHRLREQQPTQTPAPPPQEASQAPQQTPPPAP